MKHSKRGPLPKGLAGPFRCSAAKCGDTLMASLHARLDRTTCRAEQARRCSRHADAMPLAWTRRRSTCLALLDDWYERRELYARLTAYGQAGRRAEIEYPGTTFDGLREMVHWAGHWGLLPAHMELTT